MSKKAIVQFYQNENESIKEEISATTKIDEIIRIASRYGYQFTREDLKEVWQKITDFKTEIITDKPVNLIQDYEYKIESTNGEKNNGLNLSGFNGNQTIGILFEF
ncbi:Nif11-like leader peptide family natural product precursor [Nostoc sp.]|uniref:Nif11-like leader peptide family natural product precursor n=1 Tax=Nostoc sp. TaxID=1180 RepID=UPI002FF8375B